jgi:hypothetical protein
LSAVCLAGTPPIMVAYKMPPYTSGFARTFYNLFGSGVSCLSIKRLRDLEIEFLICEILSTLCK